MTSCGQALKQECYFPGVFCDDGDAPAKLLCQLYGHVMLCTGCLNGNWIENVDNGVLACLVLFRLVGCCICLGCCIRSVGLSSAHPMPCVALWSMTGEWSHQVFVTVEKMILIKSKIIFKCDLNQDQIIDQSIY